MRVLDFLHSTVVLLRLALLSTVALLKPSTWRLALRNVGRNGRRTAVVLTGVSVGLGGMMLAMAVNYGMIFQMVESAIRTELGHVQVHGPGWEEQPGIEVRLPSDRIPSDLEQRAPGLRAWAPRVRGEGLVYSPRASVGVRVVGIDPAREASVTVLADSMTQGVFLDGERRKVLVGERLADRLKVDVGAKVVLSAQDVSGEMTGEAFRIAGFFRTASRELDESAVFLRLDEARRLFGLGDEVSEVVLVAHAESGSGPLRDWLAAQAPQAEVRTWKEIRPFLVQIIDMFEQTGWVVYAAIFVAMAFGIANVLLMSVMERTREIGILSAIGMPADRLVAMVLAEALVVTLGGVALGAALGFGGTALLSDGIDLSTWGEGLESFGIPTRIVPVLPAHQLGIPIVIAIVTAVVASLWPAIRAVRTRPAEAVRHV